MKSASPSKRTPNSRKITPMVNPNIPSPQDPFEPIRKRDKMHSRNGSPTGKTQILQNSNDLFYSYPIEKDNSTPKKLPPISKAKTPNPEPNPNFLPLIPVTSGNSKTSKLQSNSSQLQNNFSKTSDDSPNTNKLKIDQKPSFESERKLNFKQQKNKLNSAIDQFFQSLNDISIPLAVEKFISSQFSGSSVIYWEENPSINTLYSPKLQRAINNHESLVGFALSERKIIKISQAIDHPSFDSKIDSAVIDPYAPLILFPLFDQSNNVVAIVEIVRSRDSRVVLQKEERLIALFQNKFQIFSKWILERSYPAVIPQLMVLMTVEQFILEFQSHMKKTFQCSSSEIWEKKEGVLKRYSSTIESHDEFTCGIINDIIQRTDIGNMINCRYSPSYREEIDGTYDSILSSPIIDEKNDARYIIVLRGKGSDFFNIEDEKRLKCLSEMLIVGFKNAQKVSSAVDKDDKTADFNTVASHLPASKNKFKSKNILTAIMTSLAKYTLADRAWFYVVNHKRNEIVTIYCPGSTKAMRMKIGEGHAGIATQTGQTINCPDVKYDDRFNPTANKFLNYKTISLLSVPILDTSGDTIAVIQLFNKKDSCPFSQFDISITKIFGTLCACLLENSALKNRLDEIEFHSNQLLEIIGTSDLLKISELIRSTMKSEKCDIYLYDEASVSLYPLNPQQDEKIDLVQNGYNEFFTKNENVYSNNVDVDHILNKLTFTTPPDNLYIAPLSIENGEHKFGILQILNKNGPFTDCNLSFLKIFQFIISLIIENNNERDYLKNGIIRKEMKKYINYDEFDKVTVPAIFTLSNTEVDHFTSIDFNIFGCNLVQLFKIIFHVFDSTGVLSKFNISNTQLFEFISVVKDKYNNISFHNFQRVVDYIQYFIYECITAKLTSFFQPIEIFGLILSLLFSFIGNHGENDTFLRETESPISILYQKSGKLTETNQCSIAFNIMRSPTIHIFDHLTEDEKLKVWKIIVILMLESNIYIESKAYQQYDEVRRKSMIDLNTEVHRSLILIFLYKTCIAAFYSRNFELAEISREKEKEEMIMLGNEELKRKIPFSCPYNCADLYNTEKVMFERKKIVLRNFKLISDVFADLKIAYKRVKGNFKSWIPTLK